MNVLSLLRKDHQEIRELFAKFEAAGKTAHDRKSELFEEIRLAFKIHSKAEEEIFYPQLKAFNGEGRKLVATGLNEHKNIDHLLTQISRLNPANEKFDDRVMVLIEDTERHFDEEEREIFRFAKENCPDEQLETLGIEIENRKQALERQLVA